MPDLRTTWEQLVNLAIAGVARQEIPAIDGDDVVGQFCAGIAAGERPAYFLNLAGTMALCRLAGALPLHESAPPPAPAAAEAQPYCSAQAARLLRLALSEPQLHGVLPEWIALVTQHRQVLPPELLPTVLHALVKSPELRPAFLPVIGERGCWLARLNPEWHPCVQPTTAAACRDAWETGSRAERVAALANLRALDPAGARALLEEARVVEPLETLAALIPALGVNLSAEDEPLLASLLDDKRKTIRRPVAALLLRLADTAYQQRMLLRAGAWIAITPAQTGALFPPALKQEVRLEVTLPDQFDAAWARDAIEETPPQGLGAKSWWLQQIVMAVPLAYWETAGHCTAAALVAAIHAHEHRALLLRGWLLAAQHQRNVPWIIALLRSGEASVIRLAVAEAFAALSPSQREQVLISLLTEDAPAGVLDLLRLCTDPWSAELSEQVIAYPIDAGQRQLFEPLAYYLHPRYLATCRSTFQQTMSESPGAFETRLLAVMQFREELYGGQYQT